MTRVFWFWSGEWRCQHRSGGTKQHYQTSFWTRSRTLMAALLMNPLAIAATSAADEERFRLLPTALGSYSWPITTSEPLAQAYFDQGMQLRYGYSMRDAARSMAEARKIDPDCAMCFWGEAFALGSFLNRKMTADNAVLAHKAITQAAKLTDRLTSLEADLIRAATVRYPKDFDPENRRPVDKAFAEAMAEVYAKYPEHPEVATVYSIALFLLEERRGYRELTDPNLKTLHSLLTGVLDANPEHPGACHLYIHATESTAQPELGLPCAERLGASIPGASHIQHMPSHTWNEVGLWNRSVKANLRAQKVDDAALRKEGFSYGRSHNLHMLLFAASFDGQGAVAITAGDDYHELTGNPMYALLTRVRFGKFEDILQYDERPEAERDAAFYDFAMGYAALRTGDSEGAVKQRDALLTYAKSTEDRFRYHDAGTLIDVLAHLLSGEILRTVGDLSEAIVHFHEAVRLEDSLDYDEPEPFPFAARHWLGAALLEAGRSMEAELAYRTELSDHPHNGWSLFGLRQAISSQGKTDRRTDLDLAASWERADVELNASRF
ncbi:MAG: hypothetical protein AAF991_08880 [Pseudomonadota bacterium]